MRQGYHMGMGGYGSYILIFSLIIFSIVVFLALKGKPSPNLFIIRLIDILKVKYASDIITVDEYIERKSIIEDIEYSNPYTPILIERYANCEMDTREFFEIKNEIESSIIDNSSREKLAKGELSYAELKSRNASET